MASNDCDVNVHLSYVVILKWMLWEFAHNKAILPRLSVLSLNQIVSILYLFGHDGPTKVQVLLASDLWQP